MWLFLFPPSRMGLGEAGSRIIVFFCGDPFALTMHVSGLATISLFFIFFGGLARGVYRGIINNGCFLIYFSFPLCYMCVCYHFSSLLFVNYG